MKINIIRLKDLLKSFEQILTESNAKPCLNVDESGTKWTIDSNPLNYKPQIKTKKEKTPMNSPTNGKLTKYLTRFKYKTKLKY